MSDQQKKKEDFIRGTMGLYPKGTFPSAEYRHGAASAGRDIYTGKTHWQIAQEEEDRLGAKQRTQEMDAGLATNTSTGLGVDPVKAVKVFAVVTAVVGTLYGIDKIIEKTGILDSNIQTYNRDGSEKEPKKPIGGGQNMIVVADAQHLYKDTTLTEAEPSYTLKKGDCVAAMANLGGRGKQPEGITRLKLTTQGGHEKFFFVPTGSLEEKTKGTVCKHMVP